MTRPVPAPVPASTDQVKLLAVEVLSNHWYTLRKVTLELRRRDGQWQRQVREAYDRGNGAVVLLHDPRRGMVVLTRQFRLPTFLNGNVQGQLIEACAGLLDGDDPETCVRREAEEETGFRVRTPRKVFEAYMSPGSVTERVHCYAGAYSREAARGPGGGLEADGEDIEVVELDFADALAAVADGRICDGKTVLLLQWAALHGPVGLRR